MGQWFTRKVIRGQVWVKFVKKSQIGLYVYNITYVTYVLTPDLIIAMFRLKSYFFLNFFRLLTSQGTKGGLDESVHV